MSFLSVQEADDEFWGVADPEVGRVTGKYYVNRKARLSPGVSYDKEMQERLWQLLEEQTGAHYTIPPGTP